MTQPVKPAPPQTADYNVYLHNGDQQVVVAVPGASKVFVENDVLYFNNEAGDTEAIFYAWTYVQRG